MPVSNLDLLARSAQLRAKLDSLMPSRFTAQVLPSGKQLSLADVVITHNEVNEKHGVGILTQRIFRDPGNIISIRSQDHFNAEQSFGGLHFCLSHAEPSRSKVYQGTLKALEGHTVGRLVCIPYYPDDVRSAIAIKDIFDAPLCTYIMDDQNICCSDGIPDYLMSELLSKSALRLAISPELRSAYEHKFGVKFWLLPPVVSANLIQTTPSLPPSLGDRRSGGAIVGNIWGVKWLEMLRKTVRHSGFTLDWYCDGALRWHNCTESDLAKDGIVVRGGLREDQLASVLRRLDFVLLPSGTLEDSDDRRAIAQLSLPSKVPFILSTSNTPIIVMGSKETAAAKFVTRFQIGAVASYSTGEFLRAAKYVSSSATQLAMRHNAAAMAAAFSAEGIQEWIWNSLRLGKPCDERFERFFMAGAAT